MLDYQLYSDAMGASPNYMAQMAPSGYHNNMNQTHKKLAESKMRGRLKLKEQEAKKAQVAAGK